MSSFCSVPLDPYRYSTFTNSTSLFPPRDFLSVFQTMCSFIFILCNYCIFRWTMPTTIIYILSTMSLAFYFYSKSHTLLRQTWLPILVLLTQPHNMILLPFHICLENVIKRLQFNSEELANVYNFFGWTLFFQLVCKNSRILKYLRNFQVTNFP